MQAKDEDIELLESEIYDNKHKIVFQEHNSRAHWNKAKFFGIVLCELVLTWGIIELLEVTESKWIPAVSSIGFNVVSSMLIYVFGFRNKLTVDENAVKEDVNKRIQEVRGKKESLVINNSLASSYLLNATKNLV